MDLSSFGTVEDEESLPGVEEDLPLLETQQPVLEEQKKEQADYGAGGFLPTEFAWIDPNNPATKSCMVTEGFKNYPYPAQIESAPFLQDNCWMVRIKWKDWSETYKTVECSQCEKHSERRPRRSSAAVARSLNVDELLDPPDEKKKRASLSNGKKGRKKKRTLAVPAVVSVQTNKARRTVSEIPMTPNNNNAANTQVSPSPMSPPRIHLKSKLSEGKQDDDDFFSEGDDSYNNIVSKEGYISSLSADERQFAPGAPSCAGLQTTTAAATGKSFTDVAASTSSDYETAVEEEDVANNDEDDDDDRKPAARPKDDKKKYESAKDYLEDMMEGVTEQEVEAALQEVGYPYGLQAAVATIRKNQKWTEPRPFQAEVGMRVKKPFSGTYYYGTVTQDAEHVLDEKGVKKPMWHVKYDDGDEEDFTMEELIRYRVARTRIPAPCRGRQLHCLELFCGRAIVSQEFCERNWKIASVDLCPLSNATIRKDILDLETEDLPFVPDFIWASLPCHTYSRLAGGKHRSLREGNFEKTEEAHLANALFAKMAKILRWAKKIVPHLVVVIENPVGSLAKMPLMEEFCNSFPLHSVQVDYCAFGREEKKPTMIWSNDMRLIENLQRFRCGQQYCQYHPGPHGVGVRGGGGLYDFSAIPQPLAAEVADYVTAKFFLDRIRLTRAASLQAEDWTDDSM